MTKKVVYVISNIDRWVAFEWVYNSFINSTITIDFIIISPKEGYFCQFLEKNKADFYHIPFKGKKSYPHIISKLYSIFTEKKYDAIHCHFLDATICGLTAGYIAGIKKRIFTRHHSDFHHQYAPKGILLDKYCNSLSTKVVAISLVVQNILIKKENVKPEKVVIINHGFDFSFFGNIPDNEIMRLKNKYSLHQKFTIGVISRFIEWKGIQYIIPAFKQFVTQNPNSVLVLANANGPYKEQIISLLEQNLQKEQYRLISFESDIAILYKCFNTFIHTPISPSAEAFGQVYVEALAAAVPAIVTKSGIAFEFIEDKENAILVEYKNSKEILEALNVVATDEPLRKKLMINGRKDVEELFDLSLMTKKLTELYYE